MAYIGKVPTAVPLSGADLEDNIITSAKIVDGTIATADISDGAVTSVKTTGVGGANTPFTTVKKTNDQTLSHGTDTLITFDNVVNESASSIFDLSNNRFTVVTAGTYLILPQLRFYDSDNQCERVQCNMRLNGSVRKSFIYYDAGYSSNGNGTREVCLGSGFLETLSANNYIEMYAYVATADGGTLVAESDYLGTTLGIMKIIT